MGVRPDCDNFIKAVFDSCNKVVWKDDGCVAGVSAMKWYVPLHEEPWVEVRIYELEFSTKKA